MDNFSEYINECYKSEIDSCLDKLHKELDKIGVSRERRINGYTYFKDSSRKFKFKTYENGKDFMCYIVNKSDESFVAELGALKKYSASVIVDMIKDY